MSKPGKSLKALCKRLGVRLTVKRGKKRVYKSIKVLKAQCANKKKKTVKKKRRRKFGTNTSVKSKIMKQAISLEKKIKSNPQKLKKAEETVKKVTKNMKPFEVVFITLMVIFGPIVGLGIWGILLGIDTDCLQPLPEDSKYEQLKEELEKKHNYYSDDVELEAILNGYIMELNKLDNEPLSCFKDPLRRFGKKTVKKSTKKDKNIKKMVKDLKKEGYNGLEIAGIVVSLLLGLPYLIIFSIMLYGLVERQLECNHKRFCNYRFNNLKANVEDFDRRPKAAKYRKERKYKKERNYKKERKFYYELV